MLADLILKNRSYRRFHQDVPVSLETLRELVDLARPSASARNLQPLRYILCTDRETNAAVFDTLAWAGYLKDWPGPVEGERPAAYIVVFGDKTLSQSFGVDHGIAMQSILLGAVEKGLGGCMIGSIQREKLRQILNIPERFEILNVVALGKPKETVVIDPVGPDGDIKYWRDKDQVHHVPKRALKDIIVMERS
ncbi:MAG: nitroreductase family protein [Anaerolineae bacterium]